MPKFHIRVVDSEYQSSNEADVSDIEAARLEALRAALQIGTEAVCNGTHYFGAEIRVELEGELKERFLVSIGQSSLMEKSEPSAGSSQGPEAAAGALLRDARGRQRRPETSKRNRGASLKHRPPGP